MIYEFKVSHTRAQGLKVFVIIPTGVDVQMNRDSTHEQ